MREERLPDFEDETPHIARIYDYFLGGKDNFACDRKVAEQILQLAPETPDMARANRAFLGRAVRFVARQGIRQFIDIGTGLPTRNNVHEVVQTVWPDSHVVVYVDNDPTVLAHARALLADTPQTVVVDADLRRPEALLDDPDLRRLIDFDQPIAVILVGVLHFLPEEDQPFDAVRTLRDALPRGSYLVISHASTDNRMSELSQAQELYRSFTNRTGNGLRSREQIRVFFDGLTLIDPGLVVAQDWRPLPSTERDTGTPRWILSGVARKD
ncbi:O-methyltransferase involved in polyketide biosynthesis [Kibdelosporangium banguiense]|uniref:O-methyltransferase involved in polyketide biosynthesis n=1 Tax=Kibdelosporangium banguiense TaxID=1365924 RepID=A0ABS4TZH4_9PSEU|nr:SAM-dependent methyltransferase [Kibdelosporangium banguiense]MBP2329364.1 O-methyltransferase involved in polyketide biosynthesis [Kibdelosporangium banguiense]